MTYHEFINLSPSDIYEFRFYYGGSKYGILVEDLNTKSFYIVPTYKIPELNQSRSKLPELGERVNIDGIVKWEVPNSSHKISRPASYPLENPPKIRKLIILGAGASFDWGTTEDTLRFPLANDLFKDEWILPYSMYYDGAFQFCADLSHTNDIEAYFQHKWERVIKYHDRNLLSRVINVQFYLHDLFIDLSRKHRNPKESNYKCLVELVEDYTIRTGEHIAFINFNYDLLLEDALNRSVKYKFNSLDDYVNYKEKKTAPF